MVTCNICGSQNFGTGPGGRLSATGKPPKCLSCFSLERHRALHQIYLRLQNYIPFNTMSALQISEDKAINPGWFASLELSVYGGSNSIDIQNINRLDQNYDIVICNHVLEHVKDDQKALQELMRIVSNRGFLQLSVPDPFRKKTTKDWGYADDTQHGHYRVYGIDIEQKFKESLSSNLKYIKIFTVDPVTRMSDICFFFTHSQSIASIIQEKSYQNDSIPQLIKFNKTGNSKIYQTSGWYSSEQSGTWTRSGDAGLKINLNAEERDRIEKGLFLTVTGLGFVANEQPNTSVQLICNQKIMKIWDFKKGDYIKDFEAFVPKELLVSKSVLEITFRCPLSKSPQELGISSDSRSLGFFIKEIRFLLN